MHTSASLNNFFSASSLHVTRLNKHDAKIIQISEFITISLSASLSALYKNW